ncbi:receptor-type tyrosine-protein phosphatase H-like isoform X2 [Haliotis asinina]|uniref:receptor-type tyrosine-protein phosphatase H-like isoform X2 n=1 Tax=Haliotis asinina TaxID=109174 RepID=UPI003532769D
MDTLKYCLIVIVFSCFCSKMSNASTSTTDSTSTTTTTTAATTTQVVYGAHCFNSTQCNTSNAICTGNGMCGCADTNYYNTTSDACAQKVVYGGNCDDSTQCVTTNASCNGSTICACDDTHYHDATNDTCTQKQAFGDVCTDTSQCNTTSDTNIDCIPAGSDKKCLCKDGWYRPNKSPQSCVETSELKPTINDPPNVGTGNIDTNWTHPDVTGGYTPSYSVTWTPGTQGSPASVTANQKSYNITSLSPRTTYTVTVGLIITLHGRSQTITSDPKTFTTKQVFGGECTVRTQCDISDQNIDCVQTTLSTKSRCLCTNGTYKPLSASSCTDINVLKPVITDPATIGTGYIDITWTHTGVTEGYTSSYTVTWSSGSPISYTTDQKSYNIQPLSSGTTYTVTVQHTVTQYDRSQMITSDQRTFTTKQVFGGVCGNEVMCDTTDPNIQCIQTTESNMKCLCKDRMYKPAAFCTDIGPLKPVITDPPSTGTNNTYINWTNTDVTGGYTFNYTVTWSPGTQGSPTSVPANQKNYDIQSLSPGTTYTVTVTHTITQYGRSQTITSDSKAFTTRIGYNEPCTQGLCYDANANCDSGRCRCDPRFYRNTTCVSINQLKPTTVTAGVQNTTTITATWIAPSNTVVTGYLVTMLPGNVTPISVDKDTRTTLITGLTPGRLYTVNVKTKITYLQGRDEMTDDVSAAPNRTTPAAVVHHDMTKTNRTAPNITVVFDKAHGDADSYLVSLRGRDGDTYNQQHQPANTGQGPISVVFTGVVPAVSYDLNIVTLSGNLHSAPYTYVIRVQSTPAGVVTDLKSFGNTSRSVAVQWRRPVNPNGYIYEYVVDVKKGSPPDCVKRVIIHCTECNRTMTMEQMWIQCNSTMTVAIPKADIENASLVIQHNITGLNPDTAYSIDVVAVNEEGPGTHGQILLHLPQEGAGDPTNFMAQSMSSSSITLTWEPPQPRPGVTLYNITVFEKREDSESYDFVKTKYISGWDHHMSVIGNLSSYWVYKFDIVAGTPIGASAIVRSSPVRTMESEPVGVVDFKVEKIAGVYNQVQVSWKCPKQKDGRNGEIVNANLKYFTNAVSAYVDLLKMDKNFSADDKCMWKENVTVTTEFTYVFQVRLYNRGFAGANVSVSMDIEGGAPRQSVVRESVQKRAGETEETVSLTICPQCLNDRTNGQVNVTGLIVCKKGGSCGQSRTRRSTTSAADYNKFVNWNAASQNSFSVDYRATKQDWLAGKERDSEYAFTLGTDDCSGNQKDDFCNGKLPAGETFSVYAFSCTNHGCTTSEPTVVTTKASFPIAAVVGGLAAAVVVIVVVIVIVVIRRRRNTKMKEADPALIEPPDDLITRKRPVKMKVFEKRVEEMHKDSNLLFSEEFEDIGSLSPKHACIASETGGNKLRNRYVNILPFDQSRVKLRSTDDDDNDETDYINANYIPGYKSPREYIATQGPMTGTVSDFWRMIWEQDVSIIIMLSDLLEKGKPKVDKYWPDNLKEPVQYGDIIVEMINYSPLNKYVMKIFQLTVGEESRKVRHYFLPGWQDFGANLTPDDVISFVRDVRMQTKPTDKGPICVHCSAGVGRTGTYISLDVFKQAIDEENFEKELDVFDFVMKMRENRSYMVQTEKQYIFIHDTIKEMIIRKKKEIEERAQNNIYQNTGEHMKPEETIYANQAYEPDPEELYMNVTPGQPTTVL